jgi:geranylgeranyl diphosphate synthase type II
MGDGMDLERRIEDALRSAVALTAERPCPPKLAAALDHAIFPGGQRLRPRLLCAVAAACDGRDHTAIAAAAASIEIIHCASLVHDDLPCFDDAAMRRGRPSVHAAFGEPLAVLAGDTLIVLAFETLARSLARHPTRLQRLISIVGRAAGAPFGICAGQAFESETEIDLEAYHRAKTGALFAAASAAGAAASGHEHEPWRRLGECVGEAYQIADDIRDAVSTADEAGKPVGRDAALARPNAARLGIEPAMARLDALIAEGIASIPTCPGRERLAAAIAHEATRFLPPQLARRAA